MNQEGQLQNFLEKELKNPVSVRYLAGGLFSLYKLEIGKEINYRNFVLPAETVIKVIGSEDMAEKEFSGLKTLHDAGVRVPEPYFVLPFANLFLLFMEYIPRASGSRSAKNDLKENLKKLYSAKNSFYGLDYDNYIGTLKQKNKKAASFSDFWWESRIAPMMDLAIERNYFSRKDREQLKTIIQEKLHEWNLDRDSPRLIHGDLWNGNVIFSSRGAYLIDPAIAYSHPVQDFAMLELFGSPLSYSDYEEIAGAVEIRFHPDMIEFFQIYPLLVHVIIFGASYKPGILQFLKKHSRG